MKFSKNKVSSSGLSKFCDYATFLLAGVVLTTVAGCSSHYEPLKAPCTYNYRNGCGPVIPMPPPPVITPQANHR